MGRKRLDSINALVARNAQDFVQLRRDYEASLQAQVVSSDLKIDIKNLCGNLRSVLDYLAAEIRETHCPQATGKVFYFPILDTLSSFTGQMTAWFPGLQAAKPPLYDYLSSVQPYRGAETAWLGHFNKVNNLNKHGDLIEQTRVTTEQVSARSTSGAQVTWNPAGVRFGAGVFIGGVPVDPRTQMPVPHPSLTVQRTIWVDFKFQEPDVSVLWLMEAATTGVARIATTVATHL